MASVDGIITPRPLTDLDYRARAYWKGKTVFVTGAGGFIGSHLTEALVGAGAKVRALIQYNSNNHRDWLEDSPPEIQDALDIWFGDVRDSDYMRSFVKGCDYGFHLAALIAIPYSYQAPRSYVETNIMGTVNVLQACRDLGIERVIHTSTSEVYGTAISAPITESHPLQGQSPYSASKISADHMAESYYKAFDLPVVTLRPFNTYGPRQSMRAFIPTILRQAMAGDTIRVGNLAPTRDFNYVDDTVNGFLLAGQCAEAEGQTIQVASGVETSLQTLVETVTGMVEHPVDVVQEAQRFRPESSEVFRLWGAINKAQSTFQYEPQVDLDEGLQRTMAWTRQWFEKNPNAKAKVAQYHV